MLRVIRVFGLALAIGLGGLGCQSNPQVVPVVQPVYVVVQEQPEPLEADEARELRLWLDWIQDSPLYDTLIA